MTPEQARLERIARKLLLTYLVMAIITFGIAWNREPWAKDKEEARTLAVCVIAATWPLYWSTKIFSFLQPS